MGISSALNAAITGLEVNTSALSAISDNIANSATYGYKRAEVEFSSLVVNGDNPASYEAGGVRSTSYRDVESKGAIISTSNSTDIAINGPGLLAVVEAEKRDSLMDLQNPLTVSTGSFTRDDQGYMVTESGLQLLAWPTPDGEPRTDVVRNSIIDLEPVRIKGIDFASNPTTYIDFGSNLPSTADIGDTFSTGAEYYDALGESQILSVQFTKTDENAWTITFADTQSGIAFGENEIEVTFHPDDSAGAEPGALDSITAGTSPNFTYDSGSGTLVLDLDGQIINLNFGPEDSLENLTQLAANFAPVAIKKDGDPISELARIEISSKGMLDAIYDSGYRKTLYHIPLLRVANPNGLIPVNNQAFAISRDSGDFYLSNAGEGSSGTMSGYALEQSTTDIAEELTDLIQVQRAYSSNATVVRTVDEMLQETTNLKR